MNVGSSVFPSYSQLFVLLSVVAAADLFLMTDGKPTKMETSPVTPVKKNRFFKSWSFKETITMSGLFQGYFCSTDFLT